MNELERQERVAPCGLDCGTCPVNKDNITLKMRTAVAAMFRVAPQNAQCEGCRPTDGSPLPCSDCATYRCAQEKGLQYCSECEGFPCRRLMPAADGAGRYPHNTKLYNLCRMRLLGLERWLEEAAADRERYFQGTFVLGEGPLFKEERE